MPEWKDVGIGGLLALLVLREVFNFLKSRKSEKPTAAGEQSVEFWREQMRDLILQILAQTITRTLDQQIMVSSEIRDLQKGTNEGIIKLITIYEAKNR
ncbi:MAG TPA: hypothetical protein VNX26_12175 [Candidatus Acidoferrum sp.]|nr:hypothetical protein [Candidatus Acidoferrum sp.]